MKISQFNSRSFPPDTGIDNVVGQDEFFNKDKKHSTEKNSPFCKASAN